MTLDFNQLVFILPFAFAIHNIEEAFRMEKWTKSIPSGIHPPVTTPQFAIAVSLFTILGFLVIMLKDYYPGEKIFLYVVTGFAGMIFLNVFFPHLIATIYLKKYTPGVVSGVLINLPLTSAIILTIYNEEKLTVGQIGTSTLIGGITGAMLAYAFLRIGKMIIRHK